MNRIVQILIKNHVFLLFIILEFISFQMLIKNHFIFESKILQHTTELSSYLFLKEREIKDYFLLTKENDELLKNNEILFQENQLFKKTVKLNQLKLTDSVWTNNTMGVQAKVLKNSWNQKRNFITIDAVH